ncbi:MAG: HEAT repeat domain-containing protein [Gemmataceae bacterium]|nr:HEAT repeat domain-containing protein [Gemmataceae bacterium]
MTPKRGQWWRAGRAVGRAVSGAAAAAVSGAALLGACGCAAFWSEVSSRERDMTFVWGRPDPLVVLRDHTDNQRKADALARLQEPLQNGGTKVEQDLYIQILSRAALNEEAGRVEPMSRDPLCRLSAIRVLGEYKDPRVVPILEKAYLDPQPFTPEMNAIIRQQALASLDQTGSKEALPVLIRAARQPSSSPVSSLTERQSIVDEKVAAVRALGKHSHYEAVDTLVHLLETDKDVAVRHCAHESLKSATKRDLPDDPAQWRALLTTGTAPAQPTANPIERVTGWLSRSDGDKK